MRIFVDVNLFIDVQRKRENWKKSFQVIRSVLEGKNQGYISALTPTIVYFLRKPVLGEKMAKEQMLDVTSGFKVVDLTEKILKDAAVDQRMADFEDAIQLHSALKNAQVIITRNKDDFEQVRKDIEILTPEEFLDKYGKNLTAPGR